MVQLISEPRFPVVEEDPSVGRVIRAFRNSDWRNFVLVTLVTLPFGYAAGRPVLMRPTMYMATTLSGAFGICLGWQSSFARLTGFRENAEEVSKYGVVASTDPNPAPSA